MFFFDSEILLKVTKIISLSGYQLYYILDNAFCKHVIIYL